MKNKILYLFSCFFLTPFLLAQEEEAPVASKTEEQLVMAKAIIKDRIPGLEEFLEKGAAKMKGNGFTKNQENQVASLLATVKAESEKLKPMLQQIYGEPAIPEGKTIDEVVSLEENMTDLDPVTAGEADDPFGVTGAAGGGEDAFAPPAEEGAAEEVVAEEPEPAEEEVAEEPEPAEEAEEELL